MEKTIMKKISKILFALTFLIAGICFVNTGIQAKASYRTYVSAAKQTQWGTNGASISWEYKDSSYSTTKTAGFNIYVGLSYSEMTKAGNTTTTSYNLSGLQDGKRYYVRIKPYDTTGTESTSYASATIETIPATVKNFRQDRWYYFIHVLYVAWDRMETADQYTVCLYNYKGKRVGKPLVLQGYATSAEFNNMKDQVYKVTIQAQKTVNGTTYTTPISTIECFNQARISSAKISGKNLVLRWRKVGGATGYDIYVSRNKTSGYQKVKSVGKNVSKVVIPKFKGKAFNKRKTYYVYVETKKKSGKRVSKSGRLYYWNTKDTSYGYF